MAISVHELTEYISWASDDYLHLALSDGTDGKITKANIISGLATPGALDVYYVKRSNNLSDIANPELARANLNLGSIALLNEITKSDIVDFNEADYATAAQGALANSALQPGDNISELVNDAGYILTSQKGVANGVASLDSNGKIPEIQIPAIAISNTFVVDSELEMLALDAQVGDIAIRNDESKSYILQGPDASDLSDWQDLKTPADAVSSVNGQTGTVILDADDIDDSVTTNKFVTSAQITKLAGIEAGAQVNTVDSVNGQTGTVVLVKADVGLSNVDNTSDLAKPISTATQTALNAKQDTITGAATTITGSNLTANRAVISNGSGKVAVSTVTSTELGYVSGVTSAIQTQLNDKATSAQGALADTAVQPGANITVLTNDAGYITSADAPVQSVNGSTGTVVLTKASVGLGNVDDTSDLAKPISTATQTALDGKQATITGAATTITGSNLTASRALVSDSSGKVAVSSVMSSEVAHLSGVTAGIQGQINAKANSSVNLVAGTGLTGGGDLTEDRSFAVTYGTTAGTAAQGNDSRLSDNREWTAATVSQAEAEAGTATTARKWTAQRVRQAVVAWWNTIGTPIGKALLNLANPSGTRFIRINADNTVTARSDSEMRTDLGLGTAATAALTTSTSDTTVGRVLTVGYMGLGSTNFGSGGDPLVILDNLAVVRPTGFYRYSLSATNKPTNENGYLIYITRNTTTIGIRATTDSGRVFNCNWDGVATTLTWIECYTASTTVPISSGGTNADNAADARTNLGLGNSATLDTGTTAGTVATGDHTHGDVTTSVSGFMSAADKTKLDGVANNATANQTDVYLLSRANHTGTQSHTTIAGLGTAATANVTTSKVDLTAGRALTTGYGGLLSEDVVWSDTLYGSGRATDLNSRFKNALSGVVDATNQPFGNAGVLAGHLTLPLTAGGRGLQFYFSPNTHTNRLAFRTYNSPTFQPWVDILHTGSTIPNTQITGLGTAATLNTGTTAGTVALGDHTHASATTSVAGFMSSADKTKLDGIATNAEVNQNAFTTVAVSGQSDVVADSKTDTLTFAAGSGITLTTNATTDTITIAATGSGTVTEVVAGSGLIGGGTSSTVVLGVGEGDGISVTSSTVAVDSTVVRTTGTQSIGGAKTFTSEVTAPSFNTTSSLKYKKDVMPFENALEKLMAIDVITYKRKIPEGEPQDDKTYLGVSAESLAKVVPELVNFKDGEADSVNYAQGFALCVQAIQELVKNRGD